MKTKGRIIGLLGFWTIVAGIWRFNPAAELWSNLIAGLIIIVGAFSLLDQHRNAGTLSVILGLWLMISTVIPVLAVGIPFMLNNVITGLILTIAGFAVAASTPRVEAVKPEDTQHAA